MPTRWFRSEYEGEYEHYGHPEADDRIPQWEVDEVAEGDYEPNPTTGYDPIHDRDMRFSSAGWGDLVARSDDRPDPVTILPRDLAVYDAVAGRLRRVIGVDPSKIGVYSEAGVVTLTGTVASNEMKRRVVEAVARAPNVARVVERLQVAEHA
jgi:hypothetical protein